MQSLLPAVEVQLTPYRKAAKSRDMLQLEHEALLKELHTESLYKKHIKDRCFMCLLWFKNSWVHYQVFGNSCSVCSGRIIRVYFNSKQKNKTKLTKEQATFFLALRRQWVLDNYQNLKPSRRPKRFIPSLCPVEELSEV